MSLVTYRVAVRSALVGQCLADFLVLEGAFATVISAPKGAQVLAQCYPGTMDAALSALRLGSV